MQLYINAKEDILWPGSDTTRKGEILIVVLVPLADNCA